MLDYSIVRVIGARRALTILSAIFFAAPTLLTYSFVKLVPHGAATHVVTITLYVLEYIGVGACASILAPLSPPLTSLGAAIRAVRRTLPIAVVVCVALFVLILGTVVSAIPFIYFWVQNPRENGIWLLVCAIPVATVFVALIIWFVLITNIATAAIVRDGLGARMALLASSRRLFARGQRRRGAAVVFCGSAPWIFVQAITYYLYYNQRHVWTYWEPASLLIWIPILLFELSLCLTYDEDLRARIEGADLFSTAERILPAVGPSATGSARAEP
jgi:hypothetical protein